MKIRVFLAAIVVLALHLPFIQADPDFNISGSRDANTDEGLYSGQIRNYINHHDFTLNKSDSFVKTPLFGLSLYLPLKIFGTSLSVGRLTVLLISLFLCGYIFSRNSYYGALGMVSVILVLAEYHIFHYYHYCMAELLCTSLIFTGIYLLVQADKNDSRLRDCFLSATSFSMAYYLKFQYVYVIIIPVLLLSIFWLTHSGNRKFLMRQLLFTGAFLTAYVLLYFLVWYLPNKELYDHVMANQTANKFVQLSGLYDYLRFLKDNLFLKGYLKIYTLSMVILFFTGLVLLYKRRTGEFPLLFIGLSCWFLVEMHKIMLIYLPTRYLISFYFPMGLIMSLVLTELLLSAGKSWLIKVIKTLAITMVLVFAVKNAISWQQSVKNRTFTIKEANNYLAGYDFKDKPVMGSWAPSLTWKCKAMTYPVWKNYFNDKDVLNAFNPAVIIAEHDEEDSNQAYSLQGIDLSACADSVKTFTVNRWTLKIYWIRQNTH